MNQGVHYWELVENWFRLGRQQFGIAPVLTQGSQWDVELLITACDSGINFGPWLQVDHLKCWSCQLVCQKKKASSAAAKSMQIKQSLLEHFQEQGVVYLGFIIWFSYRFVEFEV
jgi:hypothetical protein